VIDVAPILLKGIGGSFDLGVIKKLNKSLTLRMLCISSAKIGVLSLSSKNQGFLGKFNSLRKIDF